MSATVPRTKRRFGQHFLADEQIVEAIVETLDPRPGETLVEIGPGPGVLTAPVLSRSGHLTAVEIDRDLAAGLRTDPALAAGLTLINTDALRFDFRQLGRGLRLFGNLPYNISTPLLFHLLDQRDAIQDMLFMLQREVVERITAPPGGKAYGRLSVMVQCCCDTEPLMRVPAHAFRPPPRVESQVIALRPRPSATNLDTSTLERVVRTAFSAWRKRLAKALSPLLHPDRIAAAGIDGDLRPERLSVAEFQRLAAQVDEPT